jgi:hypothetical protein
MAVVRLSRRKGAERDEKRPEVGLSRGLGGSDNLPGMAAFCGIPTANQGAEKECREWQDWRGELPASKHSLVVFQLVAGIAFLASCSPENPDIPSAVSIPPTARGPVRGLPSGLRS